MEHGDYTIRSYRPRDITEIGEILTHLYGLDKETNIRYFQWKYEKNPHFSEPVGFVATYEEKIVGFRGFFVTKWKLGSEDKTLLLLSSSDVCVHPNHRRKGLFKAMTKLAVNENANKSFNGYVNLSSNQKSTPCDIKMGWVNVVARKTLRKCSASSLLRYMMKQKFGLKLKGFYLPSGRFGNIEVSNRLEADKMCAVYAERNIGRNKLSLVMDNEYLRWRLQNPLKKYIFVYVWQDNRMVGYAVLGISRYCPPNTNRAAVIDFAQSNEGALDQIMYHVRKYGRNNILDIWDYGMDDGLTNIFKRNGFIKKHLTTRMQSRLRGERYMLVRPVRENYTEQDWFIGNCDIRNPKEWDIREICSDDS